MSIFPHSGGASSFATTNWSLILQLKGVGPEARTALGELIQTYWYPVYAYFRRKTGAHDPSEDLTQGLFTHLLEANSLAEVDPRRGRFRSYLLACCVHYMLNEQARIAARKRGGGRSQISLDLSAAETRYRVEPIDRLDAERIYARAWALELLDTSMRDLQEEYRTAGKVALFDQLKPTLTQGSDAPTYSDVAATCGMSVEAVKKAAQRLRGGYGAALRRRIAATVPDPSMIDDEIRELFEALAAR